jgi:hypothetical protein
MATVDINLIGIPTFADLPSNLILYPTDAPADIPGYFKMVTSMLDPDYPEPAIEFSTVPITTTNQLLARLVSSAGLLAGDVGLININTIGNVRRTSGTGLADFYFEVYHRDFLGTETLIATSGNTAPVATNTFEEFSALAFLSSANFEASDTIVIYYYANRIPGGSDPQYQFQFGGASPVRSYFPVPATNLLNVPLVNQVTEYINGNEDDVVMIKNGKVASITPTIVIDPVTINAGDWVPDAGIFKYTYSDGLITPEKVVEIIPANSAYSVVQGIEVLPLTESFNGYVEFYCNNQPTEDFNVTILVRI